MLEKKISCTPSAADSSSTATIINGTSNESLLEASAVGGGRLSRSPGVSGQVTIITEDCGSLQDEEKTFHHQRPHLFSNNSHPNRSHNSCGIETHDERDIQDDDAVLICQTSKKSIVNDPQVVLHIEDDEDDDESKSRKSICLENEGEGRRHVSIEIANPSDGRSSTSSECSGSEASSGEKRSTKHNNEGSFLSLNEQGNNTHEEHFQPDCQFVEENDTQKNGGQNIGLTSSDVDSAFEDSHYSGSSDDKGGLKTLPTNKQSGGGGSKNKSKRKPNSKQANHEKSKRQSKGRNKSHCEDIAEVVGCDGIVGAMGDECGGDLFLDKTCCSFGQKFHYDGKRQAINSYQTENNCDDGLFRNDDMEKNIVTCEDDVEDHHHHHGESAITGGGEFSKSRQAGCRSSKEISLPDSSSSRRVVGAFGGTSNYLEYHGRRKMNTSPSPPKTKEQMMLMNHLHYPEPTVFDMELSPANPQIISSSQTSCEVRYNIRNTSPSLSKYFLTK